MPKKCRFDFLFRKSTSHHSRFQKHQKTFFGRKSFFCFKVDFNFFVSIFVSGCEKRTCSYYEVNLWGIIWKDELAMWLWIHLFCCHIFTGQNIIFTWIWKMIYLINIAWKQEQNSWRYSPQSVASLIKSLSKQHHGWKCKQWEMYWCLG